jgi:hypothetical protein
LGLPIEQAPRFRGAIFLSSWDRRRPGGFDKLLKNIALIPDPFGRLRAGSSPNRSSWEKGAKLPSPTSFAWERVGHALGVTGVREYSSSLRDFIPHYSLPCPARTTAFFNPLKN